MNNSNSQEEFDSDRNNAKERLLSKNTYVGKLLFQPPNFVLTIFSTLLAQAITYFLFGMFYVEYEGLVTSFISGKLTPGFSFPSLHFIGHIGTSYLYSYLYGIAPHIEWLSYISFLYLFISAFICLYLLASLLPSKWPYWVKVFLQLATFFLIFSDHHIHFIYTRTAYMMCGSALLGLIFLFKTPESIKSHFGTFALLNLFFSIGAFTRVEAAIACVLLLSLFAIYYLHSIRLFFILLLYPFLLISAMSLGVSHEIKTSTEYYMQVEPDIEAQFAQRENLEPISYMKTRRDSALHMAASHFLWSDSKKFSPAYLRSMILPEKYMFTDERQWKRVYNDIKEISAKYWYLVMMQLILGLALFFQFTRRKYRFRHARWLIFELSFWSLTVVQTYTVKVNDRSFVPLISIFLLCHILMLIENTSDVRKRYFLFWVPAFALFAIHLYYLKSESNNLRKKLLSYQANFHKIQEVARGKYLAINPASFDYLFLSNTPFHAFDFSAFKKIYITDGYIIPFIPYYKQFLESECRCDINRYPGFLNYMRTKYNEVVVVSDPESINILSNYLHLVYNYPLPIWQEDRTSLLRVEKSDGQGILQDLKVYTLTE